MAAVNKGINGMAAVLLVAVKYVSFACFVY